MIFLKESICVDLKADIVKSQYKRQKELLEMHS